jgi:hypothetical protein
MPLITATAPYVVPAVASATYDLWTVDSLVMSGDGITAPRRLVGLNRRCRILDPERVAYPDAWEVAPASDVRRAYLAGESAPAGTNPVLSNVTMSELRIGDLNALALADSRIATAVGALMAAYEAVCREQGLM